MAGEPNTDWSDNCIDELGISQKTMAAIISNTSVVMGFMTEVRTVEYKHHT